MKEINIVIGSDHGGLALKENLKDFLDDLNITYKDFGVYDTSACDYPDIAFKVAEAVSNKEFDRGILFCGTGLGVAISANKVNGIRAVTCSDTYSAKMSIEHNDANILALGERVVGFGLARDILKVWLDSQFEGGRHIRRLEKINSYTNKKLDNVKN